MNKIIITLISILLFANSNIAQRVRDVGGKVNNDNAIVIRYELTGGKYYQ